MVYMSFTCHTLWHLSSLRDGPLFPQDLVFGGFTLELPQEHTLGSLSCVDNYFELVGFHIKISSRNSAPGRDRKFQLILCLGLRSELSWYTNWALYLWGTFCLRSLAIGYLTKDFRHSLMLTPNLACSWNLHTCLSKHLTLEILVESTYFEAHVYFDTRDASTRILILP